MKNILITGSNGQLGTAFNDVVSLLSSNNNYIFTDYDKFDICGSEEEITKFLTENKIDIIINCAAYTNVNVAQIEKEKCRLLNQEAPVKLATICKKLNIYFIHISTDYVFDGKGYKPLTEADNTNPVNHYGYTKRMGEIGIIASYCRYMIFRTSWLYYNGFATNFPSKIYHNTTIANVVFDQIGTPTYALDLANAILDIIENNKFENEQGWKNDGIYHYSNEGVCSWYDFAKEINPNIEINPIITPTNLDVKRPYFSVLDKSKYKKVFNKEIPYWKDSLKKYLKEEDVL